MQPAALPVQPLARLRREPYRLLFPLAVVLAAVGVGQWLFLTAGWARTWRGPFHAVALVEGFLACLAMGFLFTFVPRRTGRPGPSVPLLLAAAAVPVAACALAWVEWWRTSQGLFAGLLAWVLGFVVVRVRASGKAPVMPAPFLWVPVGLAGGAVGAALTAVPVWVAPRLHVAGTSLLLQGLLTGLVIGVGSVILPMFVYAGAPPARAALWRGAPLHATLAAVFVASFVAEAAGLVRAAYAARALVVVGALLVPLSMWRAPLAPGAHRWLIWLSAWLLPMGGALVAARPDLRVAALHVVFVGSFGLMALSVALHVVMMHGGRGEQLARSPWEVWALGALLLSAVVARLLVQLQPEQLRLWLALGSAAFVLALGAWARLAVAAMTSRAAP